MKRRPSLLKKIWRKLLSPKPAPAVKARAAARPVHSSLESLEGRIAPATLINPTTVTYQDFDGDIVTVKFTKSLLTNSTIAGNVLKFDTLGVDGSNATGQQLQLIDLTVAPIVLGKSLALGTGITITAVKAGAGNGIADVGYIKATGVPLGAVTVSGDLGQIDAGSNSVAIGVASLKTKTLGLRDPGITQATAGRSLVSNIIGTLGSLTVTGDVTTASVIVDNSTSFVGKIGSVTIGGSLIGRAATEAASNSTGLISSATDIGAVKIGTLATHKIDGGGGTNSGSIQAGGKILSLTVSGDIEGGTGIGSGSVDAGRSIGPVIVKGSLAGGAAKESGSISGFTLGTVTLGGSILSGGDAGSGVISSLTNIGAVKIGGSIDGSVNTTANSIGVAGIRALGTIGTVGIVGDLKGGPQRASGFIDAGGDLGAISVNAIIGGAGENSGAISAGGKIVTSTAIKVGGKTVSSTLGLTVKGNVTGGAGLGSGSVFSGGEIGPVKIGGKLEGGALDNSGSIIAGGKLGTVTIGPAVVPAVQTAVLKGGAGNFSGAVISNGAMGAVKITGHVEGGDGDFSGTIWSRDASNSAGEIAGNLAAVIITGHLQGGLGDDSGEVRADGNLAGATTGALTAGTGVGSGSIRAGQGSVVSGLVGAVTVKGTFTGSIVSEGKITSVLVADVATGGTIRAGDDLGSVTFNKDITNVVVSARGAAKQGATTDLAIGKITVLGNATGARFLGGYTTSLAPLNPDAQIGAVSVKGSWTAGDIVAGVIDAGAAGFGIEDVKIPVVVPGMDNAAIISQIASITIGGAVTGTVGGTDHFGFTAQKIGAMKVGPTVVPFAVAPNQSFEIAATSTTDVTAREVAI